MKEKIEALKTERGGWTKKSLASLGVSWPPKKGWKKKLEEVGEENERSSGNSLTTKGDL